MPEHVDGRIGVLYPGDSEQGIRDTLARLEAKIDRLAEQIADAEAEAEEIVRRAMAPAGPVPPQRRRRRSDTILRVVQVAAIVAAGLGVILAACGPVLAHARTGRCSTSCARAAAHSAARRDAVADA